MATSSRGGLDVAEIVGFRLHARFERFAASVAVEIGRTQAAIILKGVFEVPAQACVADRVLYLGFLHDETQLGRTIERHRRDGNSSGFQNGEPSRRRASRSLARAAERDYRVRAGDLLGQHARDTIRKCLQLRVTPHAAVGQHDATLVAKPALDSCGRAARTQRSDGPDTAILPRAAPAAARAKEGDPPQRYRRGPSRAPTI